MATPGLEFIARQNGADSFDAYLVKLTAELEAQGTAAASAQLFAAGNARFQEIGPIHPKTIGAIRILLQLDGFAPDGSGNKPAPFDVEKADANLKNLSAMLA